MTEPTEAPGTLVYRARVRDVILASMFSLPAVAFTIGAGVLVVLDGPAEALGLLVLALAWTTVTALLWSNARQRVTLAPDALVIQRRLVQRTIPYREIGSISVDIARGIVLRTTDGHRVMLPWPPLRTSSGAGMSRAREVHEELSRRVERARGT